MFVMEKMGGLPLDGADAARIGGFGGLQVLKPRRLSYGC
jgi:hypothetical protein